MFTSDFEGTDLLAHRGHDGRRFEVVGSHAHVEEHPRDAVDRVGHVQGRGQITDDDIGAELTKAVGALVVAAHHRPHREARRTQFLDDGSADAADAATRAGNQEHGISRPCSTSRWR